MNCQIHKAFREAFEELISRGEISGWEQVAIDFGKASPNWAWQIVEGSGHNFKTLFPLIPQFTRYISQKNQKTAERLVQKIFGTEDIVWRNKIVDSERNLAERIKLAYRSHVEFVEKLVDNMIMEEK